MQATTDHPDSHAVDHIAVDSVPTPNPDALMFRVYESLVSTGTHEYKSISATADSPLAQVLFAIPGVELVLIAPRFCTVVKDPLLDWPDLVPTLKRAIRSFLHSGEMAVFEKDAAEIGHLDEVERRILQLIEDEIRPAIAQDGGDVTYMGFVDGIVKLSMIGACGTCPSSVSTLKNGIERLLMEEVPEVRGVEQL